MIIKGGTDAWKYEITLTDDATIEEHIEAITGALIMESFMPTQIIDGYEQKIDSLKYKMEEEK